MTGPITHDVCPYTLKPLAHLDETNVEHIFPDAIGGVKDYVVRVSAKANGDLGGVIDSPLINSFLISGLRLMHGIRSRHGDPQLKFRGVIEGTATQVELTFESEGKVYAYVRNPVSNDPSGKKSEITISADARDKFVKSFIENHRKKGRTVRIAKENSVVGQQISSDLAVDLLAIKRALAKIAYAAVYEYLGDQYLADPLIPEWQKILFSTNPEEVHNSKIHGLAFDAESILEVMLPPLEPYQHAVAIANMHQKGPVVAVSLFGRGFHSLFALASETSNYGLDELEGKIAICDARGAKTTFLDFRQHFIKTADAFPSV